MKTQFSCPLPIASTFLFLCLKALPASAQIIPDATLPNNSIVTPNGSSFTITIDGGTTAGPNLFHSFREFSVPTGGEAFFNNATTIDNIITRVTGGNISNIDGLIRANGGANLFLLNPNGIVFGPNARLDIGGSFFGSTANSIVFEDGSSFSAAEPNAPPLLTVNVPVGLQYGSNPGAIRLRLATAFHVAQRNAQSGQLEVNPDHRIALVGGELELQGGSLNASGGIELGAVNSGTVGIDGSYPETIGRQNISLTDGAIASTSGESGGRLQVFGGDVSLEGRSQITSDTLGDGNGAGIKIDANNLTISGGSLVGSSSFGTGDGGDINIRIGGAIEVRGVPDNSPNATQIVTLAVTEIAGDINIDTDKLLLIDGGIVFSGNTLPFQPASPGARPGDIQIRARSIDIIGPAFSDDGPPTVVSGVFTGTFNEQRSSDITIETGRLRIADGGLITNSSIGAGQSGDIDITASGFISLSGVPPTAPNGLRGIATRSLSQEPTNNPDGAGNITIETPRLTVSDGNTISVGSLGPNSAGNINIRASFARLNDGGNITAATASGEGGNLNLGIRNGLILRGGEITAEAGGTGNGGDIEIRTGILTLLDNSRINANAFEGIGGNIDIFAIGLFQSQNSSITATSELGVNGIVNIRTIFNLSPALTDLSGNLLEQGQQVAVGCDRKERMDSFVIAGRGGIPDSPLGTISPMRGWRDFNIYSQMDMDNEDFEPMDSAQVRKIIESTESTTSNNSNLMVEAMGWVRHPDGSVELVGPGQPSMFAQGCQ